MLRLRSVSDYDEEVLPAGRHYLPCELGEVLLFIRPGHTVPVAQPAANAGVDSCWLNFFDPDELAKELGLPENEEVLMILDLGYAAEGAGPLANHGSRKPLSETVAYL